MRRSFFILPLTILASIAVACGGSPTPAPTNPLQESLGAVPVLNELGSVDQFKARFNEDGGVPRIILLMSPT